MDFGPPLGVQTCYPYKLPELDGLPERHGLEELGMYSAGFGHWVIDTMFMVMFLLKVGRHGRGARLGARALDWGFRRFSRPPFGLCLKLEAESADGQRLEVVLSHQDGYEATAIPVVSCLLQRLDGSIKKSGVWVMGQLVEPARLLSDMANGHAGRLHTQRKAASVFGLTSRRKLSKLTSFASRPLFPIRTSWRRHHFVQKSLAFLTD